MISEKSLAQDETRLSAAQRACAGTDLPEGITLSDWAFRFWGNVHAQLQRNMRLRTMYAEIGGSERSPLNPINPVWNH